MTLGFVFWETLNAHKIMNAMIVDHRNMWRKTQIPTYILLYQWTWVTLRRGTHKTPRSLRPFAPFLIHKCLFCLFFVLHFTFGTFLLYQSSIDQQRSTQAGDICPPSVQKVHSSLLMDLRLDLQAAAYLCFTFSRAVWAIFHIHPGSDFFFFALRVYNNYVHFFSVEMTNEKSKEQLRCLNCCWTDSTQTFSKKRDAVLDFSKTRSSSAAGFKLVL